MPTYDLNLKSVTPHVLWGAVGRKRSLRAVEDVSKSQKPSLTRDHHIMAGATRMPVWSDNPIHTVWFLRSSKFQDTYSSVHRK